MTKIRNLQNLLSFLGENCCIEFQDGTAIGTAPGVRPLRLYKSPEDDIGEKITDDFAWEYFQKRLGGFFLNDSNVTEEVQYGE